MPATKEESFTVTRKADLSLDLPDFTCDKCIHKQIKPPLPGRQGAFFLVYCGIPGSGKTSLMISLLTSKDAYKKAFDNVFVIMPSNSAGSLKKNIFEKHDKFYDDLDYSTLSGILEKSKEAAADKKNSLLIMDDVAASLKDTEIQGLLKQIVFNRRHYRLTVWLCVQSYTSIPLPIRKTITHFIGFRPRNKKEYASLFEELIQLPKELSEALQRYIYADGPHSFMYLDVDRSTFHKGFDEISIKGLDDGAEEDYD